LTGEKLQKLKDEVLISLLRSLEHERPPHGFDKIKA
jgi:hypothetical protein